MGLTQDRFMALLDEYGVRRFPSPTQGLKVLVFGGQRYEFNGFFQGGAEGEPPGVSEAEWRDATQAWARFEQLSKGLPAGHPREGDQVRKLDNDTFARWIEDNTQTTFGRWYFSYIVLLFAASAASKNIVRVIDLWLGDCQAALERSLSEVAMGRPPEVFVRSASMTGGCGCSGSGPLSGQGQAAASDRGADVGAGPDRAGLAHLPDCSQEMAASHPRCSPA